ncbi:MAG TPA: hypothetical protein VFU02_10950, partial [Polyangiaceae bacterium]|nr:hypothetical protein [Polyangiaceae bacterium]
MNRSRRGSIRRTDDIIQKESKGWDGMVDVVMKYTKKIGSRRSSLAWFGASLCGFLSLTAACSGKTQPLNSVPEDAAGGVGGSAGVGGAGGPSGSGTSAIVTSSNGSSTSSGGSSNQGGSGGGPSSGGSSGGEGSRPDVRADKLDILFVVDNSLNMAHKQPYFASAAAELLGQLADPECVDGDDPALAEGCPEGQHREFAPVLDMHVGVISTSLGGQGGDFCSTNAANWNSTQNDAGRLMPSVREGLSSYKNRGFLAWDGLELDTDAEHDLEALKSSVFEHVRSAGEIGCGYEATLEAMYRFLIDPSPPQEIVVIDQIAQPAKDEAGNVLIDTELLEQRADFLRPDSALAIVLLSDEDDCSIQGSGIGYLTASAAVNEQAFTMWPATEQCEADPNDPCCRSCGLIEETVPEGCLPVTEDPSCDQSRP